MEGKMPPKGADSHRLVTLFLTFDQVAYHSVTYLPTL